MMEPINYSPLPLDFSSSYTLNAIAESPLVGNNATPESTTEKVAAYVIKIFIITPLLTVCVTMDLIYWSLKTITIYPAYLRGCKNHLYDLVVLLALPILTFAMAITNSLPTIEPQRQMPSPEPQEPVRDPPTSPTPIRPVVQPLPIPQRPATATPRLTPVAPRPVTAPIKNTSSFRERIPAPTPTINEPKVVLGPEDTLWKEINKESYYEGPDYTRVSQLLEGGLNPNFLRNGMTPLSKVVMEGRYDLARLLITHGADLNFPITMGEFPLVQAILKKDFHEARYFIDRGANPDLISPGSYGKNAIIAVLSLLDTIRQDGDEKKNLDKTRSCQEMLLYMLPKADVNAHNGSALSYAIYLGRKKFVKILLKAGANVNIRFSNGNTPLTQALKDSSNCNSSLEVVKTIIDLGADPNLVAGDDTYGSSRKNFTPLQHAIVQFIDTPCYFSHVHVHLGKVLLILKKNVDPLPELNVAGANIFSLTRKLLESSLQSKDEYHKKSKIFAVAKEVMAEIFVGLLKSEREPDKVITQGDWQGCTRRAIACALAVSTGTSEALDKVMGDFDIAPLAEVWDVLQSFNGNIEVTEQTLVDRMAKFSSYDKINERFENPYIQAIHVLSKKDIKGIGDEDKRKTWYEWRTQSIGAAAIQAKLYEIFANVASDMSNDLCNVIAQYAVPEKKQNAAPKKKRDP